MPEEIESICPECEAENTIESDETDNDIECEACGWIYVPNIEEE